MAHDGPVRTCAACRAHCPQGALVRVTRNPDGSLHVDQGGKRSAGRGAYLCPADACIALAEKRQVLRRALRTEIPARCYDDIRRAAHSRTPRGPGE